MLTTIAPWAILILTCAAAAWAAIEARRARKAIESVVPCKPDSAVVTRDPSAAGGPGPADF